MVVQEQNVSALHIRFTYPSKQPYYELFNIVVDFKNVKKTTLDLPLKF
jgi:hypothetical protein